MKKICTLTVFAIILGLNIQAIAAKPLIISKGTEENPSIYFGDIPGRSQLSSEIRHFLQVSGWFDISNDEKKSDYQLNGTSSAYGELKISLTLGGATLGNWTINSTAKERAIAKTVVDKVIEKSFNDLKVQGFCHTKIAFGAETAHGVRNIYTCDIDGGEMSQITRTKTVCVEPCWTPSGNSVCYSVYGSSKISILESTVNPPRRSRVLSFFSGINLGAAVSPNGRYLALILSFDHQVDLFVKDLHNGQLRRLTKNKAVEASPCWSPGSNEIAFVSDATGAPRIHIISVNGGQSRILPTIGSDAVTPDWSTNNQIVFSAKSNGTYTLGVCNLQNNSCQRITQEAGMWESPSWAPDNRQVVCKRTIGNSSKLYVVDTRTGRSRPLLSTRYNLFSPAWSPAKPKL